MAIGGDLVYVPKDRQLVDSITRLFREAMVQELRWREVELDMERGNDGA